MSPARRWMWVAVASVGMLVAAACGSTVPDQAAGERVGAGNVADEFGSELENAPGEDELGAGTEARDRGAARTSAPQPGQGGSAPLQEGPGPGAPDAPAGGGDGAAGGPGGKIPAGSGARGVTDDTIAIGMINFDLDTTARVRGGLGGGEAEQRDSTTREIGEAIAAHINENGGVAGRQLKIVWHNSNAAELVTAEGRRRDAQRACATWTEDNEVFAFMDRAFVSDVYFGCARNSNTVMMYNTGFAMDQQLFGTMPDLWYSLNRIIADRRDRNLVENLVRRGVLTPDAKVGIVVEDWEGAKRGVSNGMEPALAAHGIEVVAKAVYPDAIESPWDTYVLQFQSAGVSHVLFAQTWDYSNGWPLLFMTRAAENQNWRPTWGIGSDNRPMGVAASGAPRAQLANMFVMGWEPRQDVGRYEETEARSSRCIQIAGRPLTHTADDVWHVYCNLLFFFQTALAQAPEISPAGMNAATDALADRYQSIEAIGGQTRFGADRHDGTAVQRDLVYDKRCADDGTNCWRYVGAPRTMP